MKILFFIPAHESIPVLKNCIENIQRYVEKPIILIHANASWHDFSTFEFTQYKNVIVLPKRFQFQKWTSMMPIIRYAHQYSLDIDYDYFSIFHTNCLFIKPGIEKYICDNDMSLYQVTNYKHPNSEYCIKRSKLLNYIDKNNVYNNHVEGNFYRKDVFLNLMGFLEQNLPEICSDPKAGEETIIPTLAYRFSRKNKIIFPYLLSFVHWNKSLDINDVKMYLTENTTVPVYYDIMSNSSKVFALKPIPRSINDPVRKYINQLG